MYMQCNIFLSFFPCENMLLLLFYFHLSFFCFFVVVVVFSCLYFVHTESFTSEEAESAFRGYALLMIINHSNIQMGHEPTGLVC